MIERISELPYFGAEEQLRKFFDETISTDEDGESLYGDDTNKIILQNRITNLDILLQKQMIWSYDLPHTEDAYFYWDWCPIGNKSDGDFWQISRWEDELELKMRDVDREFNYAQFRGYQTSRTLDEMVSPYDASNDLHAKSSSDTAKVDLDKIELVHNIMRSYIEVSEWLGDGATAYGSRNGYVSRKMSLAWLFDAIRALINWKMAHMDKYAEKDIYPLDGTYDSVNNTNGHKERFLNEGETSECGVRCSNDPDDDGYTDSFDLDQINGRCSQQIKVRSAHPNRDGVLKVRGNAWFYGERADFYTHNSFIGECRFFHNTRFFGQATFDKEINGTAMRSRWADLAEYKESDQAYEPGTLVMFGGAKEITLSNGVETHAIVTTKPGLVLNGGKQEGKTMVGIALVGTVPVRIVGSVRKFDKLVPSKKVLGAARARKWYEFWKKPIGIAMNASVDEMVECVTRLGF